MALILHPKAGCSRPPLIQDDAGAKVTLDTAMDNSLTRAEISAMRRSYGEAGLVTLPADPFEAFMTWLTEARANPVIVEANAMVLSTLGGDGDISIQSHSGGVRVSLDR